MSTQLTAPFSLTGNVKTALGISSTSNLSLKSFPNSCYAFNMNKFSSVSGDSTPTDAQKQAKNYDIVISDTHGSSYFKTTYNSQGEDPSEADAWYYSKPTTNIRTKDLTNYLYGSNSTWETYFSTLTGNYVIFPGGYCKTTYTCTFHDDPEGGYGEDDVSISFVVEDVSTSADLGLVHTIDLSSGSLALKDCYLGAVVCHTHADGSEDVYERRMSTKLRYLTANTSYGFDYIWTYLTTESPGDLRIFPVLDSGMGPTTSWGQAQGLISLNGISLDW